VAGARAAVGVVDGRSAILMRETPDGEPTYCLIVRFRRGCIQYIRDYRYARHVFDEAAWQRLE
jgi:hypothetical protein